MFFLYSYNATFIQKIFRKTEKEIGLFVNFMFHNPLIKIINYNDYVEHINLTAVEIQDASDTSKSAQLEG